jgi:hypothetical protein
MVLSVLLVYELGVSSIRRIYFPKDEDLMQEMERYGRKLAKNEREVGLEGGKIDGVPTGADGDGMGGVAYGRRDSKVLVVTPPQEPEGVSKVDFAHPKVDFAHPTWRLSVDASAAAGGGGAGASSGLAAAAHNRRSRRLDDEYVPPPFTPPVEDRERENPFDFAMPELGDERPRTPEPTGPNTKKGALSVVAREVLSAVGGSSATAAGASGSGEGGWTLQSPTSGRVLTNPAEMTLQLPTGRRRGRSPGSIGPSVEEE